MIERVPAPTATEVVRFDDGSSTRVDRYGERGPVVLGVHGITSSRKSWARLGERLASTHRLYAFDQRGHGDRATTLGPMTLERSRRDLAAVAASLPSPVDLLVGHSWGGAVVLSGAAAVKPARVLAIDPMIRVEPGTFRADYVDELRELFALRGEARERAIREMYAALDPVDREAKVHAMLGMSSEALERLGDENRVDEGGWDLREQLVAYPFPLLVHLAGEDSVVSPDDLRVLRERGGSNVAIETFEGEGHNLHRTAFDRFAESLAAFASS